MGEKHVYIRGAEERDYPFILRANEENVEVLSPMDEAKLRKFAAFAELLLVAEVEGRPAAFLIALREGIASYDSENYQWFQKKYPKFLYVDRIVIDAPYRGMGIGKWDFGRLGRRRCENPAWKFPCRQRQWRRF